jgi:Fe-S cluster assembly protein SufD
MPTGQEEEWRFTPVDQLVEHFAVKDETGGGCGCGCGCGGSKKTAEVATEDNTAQATIETVSRIDPRLGVTTPPSDRAAAAAWAASTEATIVTITGTTKPEYPVRLTITGDDERDVTPSHLLLRAEPQARGTIVLSHKGRAHLNQTIEIDVADGADLTVIVLHEGEEGTVHTASHRARLGRDAHLKHTVITLGGNLVRVTPEVVFEAPGGDADLIGLYLTDTGQHQEHRVFIDHAAPRCRSRVTYKGALQGQGAHSVWVGDVLIRKAAEGTDTYELNRNLVLVPGARADSVPNLEIETGEIEGAGHASATGRFDDEQLFYLQSRGIDPASARRLVVHGFFAELMSKIGADDVAERVVAAVDARLATALTEGEK